MCSVSALVKLVLSLPAAVSDMGRAGAAQMGWFVAVFALFLQAKLTESMLSFTGLLWGNKEGEVLKKSPVGLWRGHRQN